MKLTLRYLSLFQLICVGLLVSSCSRSVDYNTIDHADKSKPASLNNVVVTNTPGGANISYTLPASSNILYVLAEYKVNDNLKLQKKSSYLLDSMALDGFQKSRDYQVSLTVVSKAEVKSDPVLVTIHPSEPPYLLAAQNFNLIPDFGGPKIKFLNSTQKNIRYVVLGINPVTQKMSPVYQTFTSDSLVNYTVRGFAATPQQFGVYFTDQYGNSSDTNFTTITPYPESIMDKSKFAVYRLPSDFTTETWAFRGLWDGVTASSSTLHESNYSWYGQSRTVPPFPILCTFDMGVSARLSRFIYWQRCLKDGTYAWNSYSPKNFTMWGSNEARPRDQILPLQSAVGDVVGDWINLGNFAAPEKPSGLPQGQVNAADIAFSLAGFELFFTPSTPPVRYIRMQCMNNYANFAGILLQEISLYGNPE